MEIETVVANHGDDDKNSAEDDSNESCASAQSDNDDQQDLVSQIKDVLQMNLPSRKLAMITNNMIEEVIEQLKNDPNIDDSDGYCHEYFPVKIVDMAVKNLHRSLPSTSGSNSDKAEDLGVDIDDDKSKGDDDDDDDDDDNTNLNYDDMELDNDEEKNQPEQKGEPEKKPMKDEIVLVDPDEPASNTEANMTPEEKKRKDMLVLLNQMYPDVDLSYLNEIIEKFYGNPETVQTHLDQKIKAGDFPTRANMHAVEKQRLTQYCQDISQLWSCPGCGGWQVISKIIPPTVVKCVELISCGDFCAKCRTKSHAPFKCRTFLPKPENCFNGGTPRQWDAVKPADKYIFANEVVNVSIFDKLNADPDQSTDSYKLFNLRKCEDVTSTDPKDVLYNFAESIINKKNRTNISKIKSVTYVENDKLAARYQKCKDMFTLLGIPTTERLVFHGTNESIESIFEHGFLLSKCKRAFLGTGIYFSDNASKSLHYGTNLIMSRVLVGTTYIGQEKCVPNGYHSKALKPYSGYSDIILIDKEDQILPAFHIVFENEGGLPGEFARTARRFNAHFSHGTVQPTTQSGALYWSHSNLPGTSGQTEQYPQTYAEWKRMRTNRANLLSAQNSPLPASNKHTELSRPYEEWRKLNLTARRNPRINLVENNARHGNNDQFDPRNGASATAPSVHNNPLASGGQVEPNPDGNQSSTTMMRQRFYRHMRDRMFSASNSASADVPRERENVPLSSDTNFGLNNLEGATGSINQTEGDSKQCKHWTCPPTECHQISRAQAARQRMMNDIRTTPSSSAPSSSSRANNLSNLSLFGSTSSNNKPKSVVTISGHWKKAKLEKRQREMEARHEDYRRWKQHCDNKREEIDPMLSASQYKEWKEIRDTNLMDSNIHDAARQLTLEDESGANSKKELKREASKEQNNGVEKKPKMEDDNEGQVSAAEIEWIEIGQPDVNSDNTTEKDNSDEVNDMDMDDSEKQ